MIAFKGQSQIDAGYFFAPYRPGMSDQEIARVNEEIRSSIPTKFQIALLQSIRDKPMIAVLKPRQL